MKTNTNILEMQTEAGRIRLTGKRIGFVTTMEYVKERHINQDHEV